MAASPPSALAAALLPLLNQLSPADRAALAGLLSSPPAAANGGG